MDCACYNNFLRQIIKRHELVKGLKELKLIGMVAAFDEAIIEGGHHKLTFKIGQYSTT